MNEIQKIATTKERKSLNSDNLSKNTNRSTMIMLSRIKTELIITIRLNDTQKSYQKKDTWQGQCENFIRT